MDQVAKDQTIKIQAVTGRDDNGNTIPVIIVTMNNESFMIYLDRPSAKRFAMDILAAEASCNGRQVQPVERFDGNMDS